LKDRKVQFDQNMAKSDEVDVKLIDFGYIVEMNDEKNGEKGALDENIAGTPWYIAPEIICSFIESKTNLKLKYTTKSDIWAVGVIFCLLVTGKHPCSFSTRYIASKKTKNLTSEQRITLQYYFHKQANAKFKLGEEFIVD